MTALFGRNLDQIDRTGPGLVWLPAEQRSALSSLAKLVVPYRADTTVERGVTVTQTGARATSSWHERTATPLSSCCSLGMKRNLTDVAFAASRQCESMTYVLVEIDFVVAAAWDRIQRARCSRESHCIESELRGRLTHRGPIK